MIYNAGTSHVPQFCNGTNWIATGKVPGAGGAGCTGGSEGDMMYNGDNHVMQYCDGTNWRAAGGNVPISGLVGWWNLDEGSGTSAADSSGGGNTGTLQPTASWTTSGKINGALTLNGGYVSVPSASVLKPANAFTVSAWVKPNSVAAQAILKSPDGDGWTTGWRMVIDASGNINFTVTTSNNTSATSMSNQVSAGQWIHVVGVYDGATVTAYTNGGNGWGPVAATGTVTYGSSAPLEIGAANGVSNFSGTIDDVRIYNRALSASEVWRLYNGAP